MSKFDFHVVAYDKELETIDDLLLKMDRYESVMDLNPQSGFQHVIDQPARARTFIN